MSKEITIAREHTPKWHYITLALIIALALIISLVWIIHDGLNYQEQYNLTISRQSGINNLFSWGSNDDPMPLYYLAIHGLTLINGHASLYWDRVLSLGAFALLIVVSYAIGRLATGKSLTGLVGAGLIAVSPFMVWYANRATVYSLLTLVVALSQLCFIGVYKNRKWALPGYFLTSFIGLGLHFFFLAIIIPQILFLFVRHRELKRYAYWGTLLTALLSIAAFALWVNFSSKHGFNYWHYLPFSGKPSATNTFIIYFQYLFGFQPAVYTTLIVALWPFLVVLALLAVQKYVRPSPGILYLFINAVLPIILLFFVSWLWKPLFLSSYLIVCLPSFLIFIAWYLSAYKLQAMKVARYALIMGMAAMLALELINWKLAIRQDYLGTPSQNSKTFALLYKNQ